MTKNHITDWEGLKIIDKEPNRRTQQVKEAIWIRKTKTPMNRDKDIYHMFTTMSYVLMKSTCNIQQKSIHVKETSRITYKIKLLI